MPTRLSIFLYLTAATVCLGCANEGVAVHRVFRPAPFYDSIGIDRSFTFILRDQQGIGRSQLVTEEGFQRYEVGKYFNDLQPGPTSRTIYHVEEMIPPVQALRPAPQQTAHALKHRPAHHSVTQRSRPRRKTGVKITCR